MDENAVTSTVSRNEVAIAEDVGGDADEDVLALELLRTDAAAKHIAGRIVRNSPHIDRVVEREYGIGRRVDVRERRRERGNLLAADNRSVGQASHRVLIIVVDAADADLRIRR